MADDLNHIKHGWGSRALATAKIASSAVRIAGRRITGRDHHDTDRAIGEKLVHELDSMKGLAMKLGQILSYFDGALPDGTAEALRKLQQGVRPVAFEVMAAVIAEELGASVQELFEELDSTPVASASIGQVYRARLRGRPVAVKVQYPHVRDTLEADFNRIRRLSRLASLATQVDGPAIARELRERVVEECDYQHESANQERFREAFAGDDEVAIPQIFADRTSARVLTSAWIDGLDFYALVDRADQDRLDSVGMVLARFAYHSLFRLGVVNADPHPGNYLFPADGRVVFLDFGCVRQFDPSFVEAERNLARVVLDDRRDQFRDAVLATGMVPRPKRFDFDAHWEMVCHQYAPYRTQRFRFTRDYIAAGASFTGPSNPNLPRLAIPPQWIWLTRLQWGLHAVLARLQAEGPFAELLRAELG